MTTTMPATTNSRKLTLAQKQAELRDKLDSRVSKVEELIPPTMRGQANRLIKRAMLAFGRTPGLHECTIESFLCCVLDAAELGLAIDGKKAHAVPFWNAKKGCKEAKCIPDYKGLIEIARRSGTILDCYGDVVRQNDRFIAMRKDGRSVLEHEIPFGQERGEVLGAYWVMVFPNAPFRYELMDISEINKIKARSKSKDRNGNIIGPWVTDEDQMRIKTVAHRALKLYLDDPVLERALELGDRDYDGEAAQPSIPANGRSSLRSPPPPAVEVDEQYQDGPEPEDYQRDEEPAEELEEQPKRKPGRPAKAKEEPREPSSTDPSTGTQQARITELSARGPFVKHLAETKLKAWGVASVTELNHGAAKELTAVLEAELVKGKPAMEREPGSDDE